MSSTTAGATPAGLEWLPDTVRAILLVSADSNERWGGVAAAELAHMVGQTRPHTLLVNTSPGFEGPDRPLDCQSLPGLTAAMIGRHPVKEIVVASPGRSFLYIPAGLPANPLPELVRLRPFNHLVSAAAKGGTLILYVAESDIRRIASVPAGEEFAAAFDAVVVLGQPSGSLELPGWPPIVARVERPREPEAAEATARPAGFTKPKGTPTIVADREVPTAPESWLQRGLRRLRRRDPFRGVGGVVAVWIAAIVAVWLVWQGLSGWPAFSSDEDPVPARTAAQNLDPGAAPESAPGESESGAPVGTRDVTPDSARPSATAAPTGPDLTYSVLVGSYLTWDDARQRRRELATDTRLAFIAPTMVRGRLYYRVFEGAYEDRSRAEDAMRQLVEIGLKERERAWDVRPVRLAFALGNFASRAEATDERDRLHDSGLPAYVLQADAAPETTYRLYSGAFESETAAAALDSMLEESGGTAVLEPRRGRTR